MTHTIAWVILRCTARLPAVIGAAPMGKPAPVPDAEDWYANLLWHDRRKCLLLTHSSTLFSVFEADVRAVDLRDTSHFVMRLIGGELASEGLPPDLFTGLNEQVILAKTADRSVLGCMNDMSQLCGHAIAASGGLARTNLSALNRSLRRNINSARGYQRPIDMASARTSAGL